MTGYEGKPLSCYAFIQLAILANLLILLCFQQTCIAKKHPQHRIPSSCGEIHNISHPFRLKGDPEGCGDPRLELTCENNFTVLHLFSGKFHVQYINYTGQIIGVTDAGLEDDTCSFIPRYFLCDQNVSIITSADDITEETLTLNSNNVVVAFLNCSNPVIDDPQYVDLNSIGADCFDRRRSGGYIYVIFYSSFSGFVVSELKVGCHLQVATFTAWTSQLDGFYGTYYTKDSNISRSVFYGFELSWLNIICQEHCGRRTPCSVNDYTGQVNCQKCLCHHDNISTEKCGNFIVSINCIFVFYIIFVLSFKKLNTLHQFFFFFGVVLGMLW